MADLYWIDSDRIVFARKHTQDPGVELVAKTLEGKSVLLVDDDRDMLEALETVLDDQGATVRTAADGNAAVEVAGEFDPDLVVLDAMLPKRSGFLVLEKLKQGKPRGSKPRVIMITGNPGTRHRQYAESLGVDAYINKPFATDALLEKIAQLLGD